MSPKLVALRLPPGPAVLDALERVWERGDAAAPLDPDAPEAAVGRTLEALRPSGLLDGEGERSLDGGVPVEPGAALVIATSGGAKAAVLNHAALEAATAASLRRLEARSTDRWLCCLPTHHVAGIQVLLRARALGTEPIIHPRFDPDAVALARAATHVSLVPTMLDRLLDAGVDLSRFAMLLLGGAPAPQDLLDRARAAGARVVTTYGMTETCGGCVYDGVPLDAYEVRIDSDRLVRIRGPMLSGYRLREDLTHAALEDGWFVTADIGEWRHGRLVVLGRADDIVVSGGENIDAAAVEAVLRTHPAVADAAVVGRPDPVWGRAVVAYCVPRDGPTPSDATVTAHVRASMGRQAAPKEVRWVASIPRGPLGKVRREALMRDDGDEDRTRSDDRDG